MQKNIIIPTLLLICYISIDWSLFQNMAFGWPVPTIPRNAITLVAKTVEKSINPPSIVRIPKELDKVTQSLLNNILQNAKPGQKTNGSTKQFKKLGDFQDAFNDFKKFEVKNLRDIPTGKLGELNDTRKINVRTGNRKSTLEIYDPRNKSSIKIRYDNKE